MPRQVNEKPSVLVVSHERSGTHYLINSIAKNLGYSNREDSIVGTPGQLFRKIAAAEKKAVILKSHHQFDFFEPRWGDISKMVRVVYIRRDGKDCLTSCYHYMLKHAALKCFPVFDRGTEKEFSFSEFLRANPSLYPFDARYSRVPSRNMPERWARHLKGWIDSTYTVKFEDLKSDYNGTMLRLAHFLHIDPPNVFVEPGLNDRGIDNRKGVVGDSNNIFQPEDHDFFRDTVLRVMRNP